MESKRSMIHTPYDTSNIIRSVLFFGYSPFTALQFINSLKTDFNFELRRCARSISSQHTRNPSPQICLSIQQLARWILHAVVFKVTYATHIYPKSHVWFPSYTNVNLRWNILFQLIPVTIIILKTMTKSIIRCPSFVVSLSPSLSTDNAVFNCCQIITDLIINILIV